MRALLTSAGIENKTIEAEMWRLLGGKREGMKLLFITTASNYEGGEKGSWLGADIERFINLGFEVDVCDFNGIPKELWLPRFEDAEVYFFEGGNTGWLRRCIKDSGLEEELPRLLETRVWMGASAGSIVLCPTICNSLQELFDEDDFTPAGTVKGLSYVNFDFIPHMGSKHFPRVREENILMAAERLQGDEHRRVYAVDDDGAVSVNGTEIKVVSEGKVVEKEIT